MLHLAGFNHQSVALTGGPVQAAIIIGAIGIMVGKNWVFQRRFNGVQGVLKNMGAGYGTEPSHRYSNQPIAPKPATMAYGPAQPLGCLYYENCFVNVAWTLDRLHRWIYRVIWLLIAGLF